jgi:MipA family protein
MSSVTKLSLCGMLCLFLLLCVSNLVYADETADLVEPSAVTGVLVQEQPATEGFHGLLGAAVIGGQRIVGQKNTFVLPLPIIFLTYSDWAYWSFVSGGVWAFQSHDHSMKIGVGIRLHPGWSPGDDPLLSGMDDRRTSLDGSINVQWRTRIVNIGASYYHDLLAVNEGDSAMIRISKSLPVASKILLTPYANFEWQSGRLVNYYYGVHQNEIAFNRPAYEGRNMVTVRAGLWTSYWFTHSWSLAGGFNITRLGDGISDSPIVLNRYIKFGFLGIARRF